MSKLNGWQRLFVVAAIIWAIPVFFFTITAVETEAAIKADWARDIVALEKRYNSSATWFEGKSDEEIIHPVKTNEPFKFEPTSGEPLTDREAAEVEARVEARDAARTALDKEYAKQLSALPTERTRTLFLGFLFWLIPLASLYLLGVACGWIYRGFRPRSLLL